MILDIVAGSILLISMLIAWFRGFIRETLTILGLIGAGIAALFGSPYVVPYILGWFPQGKDDDGNEIMFMGMIPYDAIAVGLSYVLVFILVYIILSLFSHWLAKTAKELGLGPLDRSLGLLFGLARAVILIGFLFIPFNVLLEDEEKDEWFGESISLPYVNYTARVMRAAIPSPVQDDDKDNEEEDAATEKDGEEDSSALDLLQQKALRNMEDSLKILREEDPAQDESDKEGYNNSDREQLRQLFETQDGQ